MSVTVGHVLKVVAILSWLDGDIAQNVFSAVIGGTGGPYDDGDIVEDAVAWVTAMFANLATSLSDEIDGAEVVVYKYDTIDEDFDEVGSDAWVHNFTNTAEQLPRGNALLINAKTLDPDVNGKKYVPGITEDGVLDGLVGAAIVTALGNYADDWVTPFAGATSGASWVPGIWSPKNLNFFAASGAVIIPTIVAYQRRRKRGVGI